MAFQPFGYRFDVRSPLSPDAVKAAIRSRKKGWLDPKRGARGWIAGPFICLWLSAFDRYGPMLFGRIVGDDRGARIGGRAGSDLNGLALFSVLIPLLALFLYLIISAGDYTFRQVAILGGLILASPWVFWMSHKDRRDADPLVRFLRDTVEKPGQSPVKSPAQPLPAGFSKVLTLQISGSVLDDPATPKSVREALKDIEDDGFVILSSADQIYMQTVPEFDGYIVEKRDGDDQHHYQAVRRGEPDTKIFTFEETLSLFIAYGTGTPLPPFADWKKIRP